MSNVIEFAPALAGLGAAARFAPPGVLKRATGGARPNVRRAARPGPMPVTAPRLRPARGPVSPQVITALSGLDFSFSIFDPTKQGSLTYGTAARIIGAQNLPTVAAAGRSVRDAALKSSAGSSPGQAATGQPTFVEVFQPQNSAQKWLLGGAVVLGGVLIFSMLRRNAL